MKLNTRAALYFWHGLKTPQEKVEFLSHLSEEQWQARWQEVSPEQRKKIAASKQEALKLLEENRMASVGWTLLCMSTKIVGTYFFGPAGLIL